MDSILDAMLTVMDGLKPVSPAKSKTLLKPRLCPNCSESNTPESKFCSKCKFVLTFDAFNEVTQESEKTKQQIESMRHQFQELQQKQDDMIKKAVIFERMDNWLSSSNPDELESAIWQFLDEEDPKGHKAKDFPELVKAAKRLQKLRLAASSTENKNNNRKKNKSHNK